MLLKALLEKEYIVKWRISKVIRNFMKKESLKMKLNYEIVTLPGYRGVGLKWDGSYSEAHTLKDMISTMNERVIEFEHLIDPETLLGLSYHLRQDGFTHYSVYEVGEEQRILEGMVEIYVPEMTYFLTHHKAGENIAQTYHSISKWLKESEYEPFLDSEQKYYDPLPIKHERYPIGRDLKDPHFDILIPVVKKK